MIDHGRSKSRQFRNFFTFNRSGPLALSGLRWLSLFLTSVDEVTILHSSKSTLASTVCRECCISGSSVSTDMKNHLKRLLYGCRWKFIYQQTLCH